MGNDDDGLLFVLEPDALIIELLDRSVDGGVHNRTQVHRYSFKNGSRRLDPVALQPQDFVEEWLTRPWSEMQSRSAPETAQWHSKLHADYVSGDYTAVVPCAQKPGRWVIGIDITHLGEKELPKPQPAWFLVNDLGGYRYRMESVSDERPKGCPGQAWPGDKHPWLTEAQLKALQ